MFSELMGIKYLSNVVQFMETPASPEGRTSVRSGTGGVGGVGGAPAPLRGLLSGSSGSLAELGRAGRVFPDGPIPKHDWDWRRPRKGQGWWLKSGSMYGAYASPISRVWDSVIFHDLPLEASCCMTKPGELFVANGEGTRALCRNGPVEHDVCRIGPVGRYS